MRALPICLLAVMLSGCSVLSRSPVEPVQSTATPLKLSRQNPKASVLLPRLNSILMQKHYWVKPSVT